MINWRSQLLSELAIDYTGSSQDEMFPPKISELS